MSIGRKIAHNTTTQIIGKVISTLIGILTLSIITYSLNEQQYGYYIIATAFIQFFAIFIDFGLYIIILKYLADPAIDSEKALANVLALRLVSALIFLGLGPIVGLFFPYPPVVKLGIALMSFSYLFVTLNQTLVGVFHRFLVSHKTMIAEVSGRIILLLTSILFVRFHPTVLPALLAVVLGSAANFFLTFILSQKHIRVRLEFDMRFWKKIFHDTWPIALSVIFNLIYFKADTIILSLTRPTEDVAVYGVTYKILEVLTTFPAMFAGIMTPLLTESFMTGKKDLFRKYFQQGFDFLVILSVPMIATALVLGTDIIVFISSEKYRVAGGVLRIIIFATAAIFLGQMFANTVVAIHKQKTMVKMYAFVAVIALIGYGIFIPRYSYYGAAVMTVLSEAIIMFSSMFVILKHTHIRISLATLWKSALASTCFSGILLLLPHMHVIISLLIIMLLYPSFLYLFKGFTKEMVKDFLRFKSSSAS